MSTEERSLTRNQRIALSAVIWLLVGSLVVAFFFMSIWFGLVMLAVAGWTTCDYVHRGDIAGHVTAGISKHGYADDGAQEAFGRPEKD